MTTQKTVLIADDTAFVRDRFKAAIEGAGHRVLTARSTTELVDHLRAELPSLDLLLVDLQLPPTSGVDVVRAIRTVDDGALPVLVFSGTVTAAEEVRELAALGVAGYINEYSAVQHILPSIAPHLFPDEFTRRSSPRVSLGMPIAYRFGNTIAAAMALNLSRGGLAVRTASPLEAGARLRVRFRLPGARKEIDVHAVVCWSDPTIGMGMRFDRIDEADRKVIDEFVDAHFFRPRRT